MGQTYASGPLTNILCRGADVPGEWYSPTQPLPTRPPAFERQDTPGQKSNCTPTFASRPTVMSTG